MGVVLTPIIPRTKVKLSILSGKTIAFDASVELYQFLALIRLPGGEPLRAPDGSITSHLVGLAYRVSRLIAEYRVKPVFVFDGKPHPLKLKTLERRHALREKARREWLEALRAGDYERAFSKAVVALSLSKSMVEDAKHLLDLMGIPVVQAPQDAEAQAAYMVSKGICWAVATKDYDALLYGATRVIRFITFTGAEYLPSKGIMKPLEPELIELSETLKKLGITREQLIDIAILVGTDFNEGVKGIGPKKALALIKRYGCIERLPESIRIKLDLSEVEKVRNIFLKPKVLSDISIKFKKPNYDGIRQFLVSEKGFSPNRVETIIRRLKRARIWEEQGLKKWIA